MSETWIPAEFDPHLDPAANLAGEREMLEIWLQFHRDTLLHKCAGLTSDQLKLRSVEPSSISLLGLVRHMAEVERWWFRRCFAAEDIGDLFCTTDSPDGDFDDLDTADPAADFAAFADECRLADAIAKNRSLDDTFLHARRKEEMNLRWIYVHMIEEYARHNGHADFVRERIDGVTES